MERDTHFTSALTRNAQAHPRPKRYIWGPVRERRATSDGSSADERVTSCGTMATVEALRTRLDALQWENNRLEAENRRLREEHPEESRVLTLEAELEQSKNEVARTG